MFWVTIPLLVKMIHMMVILSSSKDNSHDGSLKKKKKKTLTQPNLIHANTRGMIKSNKTWLSQTNSIVSLLVNYLNC